jgi:hypothetical protein
MGNRALGPKRACKPVGGFDRGNGRVLQSLPFISSGALDQGEPLIFQRGAFALHKDCKNITRPPQTHLHQGTQSQSVFFGDEGLDFCWVFWEKRRSI